MIDIDNAKKEFMNYVEQYGNVESGRISLKVRHILRVVENSKFIAKELDLNEEQVSLAELIGLFHDIGRFEQVRIYDTFSDKDTGIDHAAYSLKVLYEDGLIRKFIATNKYDDIIKKAVFNHNKPVIDKSVDGDALLFSKIIRDADKLDIYKAINQEEMKDIFWYKEFDNIKMSDELMKKFEKEKLIDYKDIKNNADQIYAFYGYVLDFNFPSCFKIIKDNQYLEKFFVRIKDTFKDEDIINKTKRVLEICNKYMDKRLS